MIYKHDNQPDKTYSLASDGWAWKLTEYVKGARRTSLTLSNENEKIAFVERLKKGGWYAVKK